jgi:eukaryotic-like serine/threonine-protein kinase
MSQSEVHGAGMLKQVTLPERYVLLRHVADGGMASVWCAQDRMLGRRVAIKLLSERFAGEDDSARRFQREARTAARLSGHRNVITIYDVGETVESGRGEPPQAFIVMEYLAGGTVADALRVGAVTRSDAMGWLHQTAAALDYAHGHEILHRDIKPANLLLDDERVVHVADFGIAQLATDDTLTGDGQLLGTAAYLAPERARGHITTEASDRYSLAVVAFELLTGQRPFSAERFAAQARQHIDLPAPVASQRNPALPPAVDSVLARGMAKRPQERWATSREFADALRDALAQAGGRPAASDASVPWPVPAARTGPSRRRPRLSAAGAAAMASVDARSALAAAPGTEPPAARTPAPANAAPAPRSSAPATPAPTTAPPAARTPIPATQPPAPRDAATPPTPLADAPRRPAGNAGPLRGKRARNRAPARALALAALAAAAVGVGLAAGAGPSGSPRHTDTSLQARGPVTDAPREPAKPSRPAPSKYKPAAHAAKRKPTPNPAAPPAPSQPERPVTATSASQTTPPPTAQTLDARGHQLMETGAYSEAIPVLRQTLAAASPSSLTYAYALYDLGRSLRLAGDPKDAVSVLYRRLQIPNQTETVRLELQQALRAMGQRSVATGGGVPGHSGGAGLPGSHDRSHHSRHGPGKHRGNARD